MRPLKQTDHHGDFDALPPELQEAIIRASVEGFGRNSYKEASTEEIARRAGISKGLLFFYFRNKKALYLLPQQESTLSAHHGLPHGQSGGVGGGR